MNVDELMEKVRRQRASAQLLLDAGDSDSAANRACYAMFNAARAALLATKAPVQSEAIRTHSGLILAFSQHLIKTGALPVDLGKALSRVSEIRLIADYSDEQVTVKDATLTIESAAAFIAAIEKVVISRR